MLISACRFFTCLVPCHIRD